MSIRFSSTKKEQKNDCSDIITYPQFSGTCWFNTVLTVLFYSQHMRNMLIYKSRYWNLDTIDPENKKKSQNWEALRAFYNICREILYDTYVAENKEETYNRLEKKDPKKLLNFYIIYILKYFTNV